jgi:hypothetical protein
VFNGTINNISVISSQSVLLVEETGVPGENHHIKRKFKAIEKTILPISTKQTQLLTSNH